MLNVRPTNSTSSRLSDISSTVSFQNDAVGDGKVICYRVDSVVFDAEKLLMSNSCEIKWAIDNNSFNNKK